MIFKIYLTVFIIFLPVFIRSLNSSDNDEMSNGNDGNNALAKLVEIFSKPGAIKQMHTLLGENSIEDNSNPCPEGEDGLECRRAEARKSVDCPHGDCYCRNCSLAGSEMWSTCCRHNMRCCSHLAAACRNCDHSSLYKFCAKHFKKCIKQFNESEEFKND